MEIRHAKAAVAVVHVVVKERDGGAIELVHRRVGGMCPQERQILGQRRGQHVVSRIVGLNHRRARGVKRASRIDQRDARRIRPRPLALDRQQRCALPGIGVARLRRQRFSHLPAFARFGIQVAQPRPHFLRALTQVGLIVDDGFARPFARARWLRILRAHHRTAQRLLAPCERGLRLASFLL